MRRQLPPVLYDLSRSNGSSKLGQLSALCLCVQVAACVCLFSLDKHAAIPVDTHVWQLAARYYTPHLKGVPCVAGCAMQKQHLACLLLLKTPLYTARSDQNTVS